MAKRNNRFKLRDSERSGFTFKEIHLVKDNGFKVGPDEFDSPPPSTKSLGGEGEVSPGNTRGDYESFATPSGHDITIQYITTAGGIRSSRQSYQSGESIPYGYVVIVGSNSQIEITSNPQVTRGRQNDKLTIECVGSSVTLSDGNGLDLRRLFVMQSGSILNLFYSETDNLWHETSRTGEN